MHPYTNYFTVSSSVTDKLDNIPFNYDHAGTKEVVVNNVIGDYFNPVTKKYEISDHTFVVGYIKDSNLDQDIAIEQMQQAAMNIINELNKRQMPPHMVMPHLLTDVEKAKQVVTDDDVKISQLSKETGISEEILSDYRENPVTLKKASNSTIERLITKYYEKYFNRNEIEKFRFMLIKTVMAYLKENKKDEIDYDPVYELYKLCQQADWHRLARMEEIWRAFYTVDNQH
ncbi:XRE family transcriptional regulator [Lactobacillus helveticus]|nr:XRE family transcriptional regulator [Lactobacillus helveticus]MCT3411128.1 XRE family transcriptional regulator [Lactobacillus helveticus]MCT3432602.1 XRE family transcriptional regulator [Lactobacillus helveticus]MCT3434203.1 XRE family transcriptional regulator [Lactobacillus helveticus]